MNDQEPDDIGPSATLKGACKASGEQFLRDMWDTNALIAGITRCMHNAQFLLGMRVQEDLYDTPGLSDALDLWPSCFTAMQVIPNRISPEHRDRGGAYNAMDVVATIGDFTGGHLEFPGLGMEFWQTPGSVSGFLGRALRHKVREFQGDRVSFAWFVKDDVWVSQRAPEPMWAELRALGHFLEREDGKLRVKSTFI